MFDFPNIDPTYLYKREGTENDPYIPLIDKNHVRNRMIVLKEIPHYKEKVSVEIDGIKLNEVSHDENPLKDNEYSVDYTVGNVAFHESQNGKLATMRYLGTGYVNFPASRILMTGQTDDPIESLEQVFDRVEEGVEVLDSMSDFSFRGEYNPDSEYKKWNFVFYNNKTYVALSTNYGEFPDVSDKWQPVSSGVGFSGVFVSDKVYSIGDIVSDESLKNLYFSKKDNNEQPLTDTEYWELILTMDDIVSQTTEKLGEVDKKLLDIEQVEENISQKEKEIEDGFKDIVDSWDILNIEIDELEQEIIQKSQVWESAEQSRIVAEEIREQQISEIQEKEESRVVAESERVRLFEEMSDNITDTINNAVQTISDANETLEENRQQVITAINSLDQDKADIQKSLERMNSFSYVGEFDLEQEYVKNNMVTFDGTTYIALDDNFGIDVSITDAWAPFAKKGDSNVDITIEGVSPDESGDFSLEYLNVVRGDEFESRNEEIDLRTGDLSNLRTLNKDDLVSAINELKSRIDDIIEVMPNN